MSVDEIIGEFLDSFAAVPLLSELKMDRSNAISPMKGKENVCQQRGINLRGFPGRISSAADISSLFENLPEFILGRVNGRFRLGRRNLLLAAKEASRHNRR